MSTFSKKFVSLALSATTVVSFMGAVVPAYAQSTSDLQAQIAALLAQINALQSQLGTQGGSMSSTTFTRDLTVGSKGADVTALQNILISKGYLGAGYNTGYFGALTKAALAKWQAASGISPAAGYFGPKSRAAINAMAGPVTPPPPGGPVAPVTGLAVSLASDSPTVGSLISGSTSAARVPVLAVNLTAGTSGGVTVNELKFTKNGVLSDTAISSAYLVENGKVIAQFSSLSGGVITFSNLNLGVNAGQSRKVWLAIDPATGLSAGNTVGFSVMSASAVSAVDFNNTAITASGAFPMNGGTFTVTSVSNPSIASVTISSSSVGSSVYAGTQNVLVSQWSVSVNNSPVKLSSLNFRVIGSANKADIKNVKLFVNGTQVGQTLAQVANDSTAYFDLSGAPAVLNTGSSNIQVYADIMGSPSFNFQFELLNSYDVYAIDSQYNVPVSVTINGGNGVVITINQGQLTVALASDTPTSNVAKGGSGTTLAKFTIYAAGEPVQVKFLTFKLTFTGTTSTLSNMVKNISIVDDAGNQIGTTINTPPTSNTCDVNGSGTTAGYNAAANAYTDCFGTSSSNINYTIPANTTRVLSLKADIQTTAAFSSIQASLTGNSSNLRGQTSSQTASSGSVNGSALTLATNALTATKNSALGNQTYAKGKQQAKIGSYTLTASSAEAVRIANLTITTNASTSANFQNLTVKVGSTTYGIPVSSLSNSTDYTFSGNIIVPAGGSSQVDVYADILTTNTGAMASVTSFKSCTGTGASTNSSISCAGSLPITGQTVTVSSGPTFTVALNSNTPPAKQLVMGSTGVPLASFDFTDTANIEPIKITDLTVTQNVSSTVLTQYQNLTLWNGSTQIAGPINLSSAAPTYAAVFSGMGTNALVPQGGILTLTLKGDVPSFSVGCGGSSACTGLENTTSTFQIKASSTASIVALGKDSNASATHVSGVPTANTLTILRSKLTVTGATTGATSGRTRAASDAVGNLILTADAGFQTTLNTLSLKFEGQAVSSGTTAFVVSLIDPNTNTNWGGSGNPTCTPSTGNSCSVSFSFTSGNTVGAGTSKTLRVQLNSSNFFNAASAGDSLSVSVKANTDVDYGDGSTTAGLNLDSVDVGTGITVSQVSYE